MSRQGQYHLRYSKESNLNPVSSPSYEDLPEFATSISYYSIKRFIHSTPLTTIIEQNKAVAQILKTTNYAQGEFLTNSIPLAMFFFKL